MSSISATALVLRFRGPPGAHTNFVVVVTMLHHGNNNGVLLLPSHRYPMDSNVVVTQCSCCIAGNGIIPHTSAFRDCPVTVRTRVSVLESESRKGETPNHGIITCRRN